MEKLSRDQVKEKLGNANDVVAVEVLDENYYEEFHLPGALNVPLGDGFDERIRQAVPDKRTPVVVYCMDAECPASAKASQRMDELGYEAVYDYEAGKQDWKAAGLPVES